MPTITGRSKTGLLGAMRTFARSAIPQRIHRWNSVERLDFHQRGVMVVADPERGRRGRVVDEYATDVGLARQRVLHRLARLQIHADDAVAVHAGGPDLAGLVERDV